MRRAASLLLTAAVALAPAAWAQAPLEPRLGFAHPVAGETMVITVDRVAPGVQVELAFLDAAGEPFTKIVTESAPRGDADGSGCARFEVPIPADVAATTIRLDASVLAATGVVRLSETVTLQAPSLLVTGTSREGAWLYRLPVTDSAQASFTGARRVFLGAGIPAGAVRDGRGTRTFVVADAPAGIVRMIPDDGGLAADVVLGRGIRSIDVTPDGRTILVAGGQADQPGWLAVLDAATGDEIAPRVPLDPLGADGGRLVVAPDGLHALVSVDGVWLREINLVRHLPGALIQVGRPGEDRILDLEIVEGHVVALSIPRSRAGAGTVNEFPGAGDGRFDHFHQVASTGTRGLDVGLHRADASLFLLDGRGARVTVLDPETLEVRERFDVMPGAEALLLPPDRATAAGALLYGAPARIQPFRTAGGFTLAPAESLGLSVRSVPVQGRASRMPWLFLAREPEGILALHAETLERVLLDLPIRVRHVAVAH